jgi:hypothetical protein
MNEELQKQLAEMLAALMRVAQDGSAWAQGQIPMLVQEKILYGRVSMTAWMLLYGLPPDDERHEVPLR